MSKPLSGYRFIELAGLGPAPYAGQLFADMGAEVILVNRFGDNGIAPMANVPFVSNRGKKTIALNLQTPQGVKTLLDLVKTADVLFEGFRPGVTERLGLGPKDCHAANPKLIYGRMTGWGQNGPWANMAGHDINYISVTGALGAMGREGSPPMPPLNLVGDYGGGAMFLVTGILAALLKAAKTGKGEIIDAAMIDGVSSLMSVFYSLGGLGQWQDKRASNLIDGGMPYYRCYETQDGKYMAVGCLEPQFFAIMLGLLEIDPQDFGAQNDTEQHAEQHKKLEVIFAQKTRAQWANIFDGSDACVTPVLSFNEAPNHPQNQARGGLKQHGMFTHPRSAPIFGTNYEDEVFDIPSANSHAEELFDELGYSEDMITGLKAQNITP